MVGVAAARGVMGQHRRPRATQPSPDLNLIERLRWIVESKARWATHRPAFAASQAAIDRLFDTLRDGAADRAWLSTGKFPVTGQKTPGFPRRRASPSGAAAYRLTPRKGGYIGGEQPLAHRS